MGKWAKWITGGLGFVVGGPIGAVIGFLIGSAIDGSTLQVGTGHSTQGDFKMSLLVLMAAVMKADGKVVKSELQVVKSFLVRNFGEEQALEALQILKKLLDENYDIVPVCQQIGQSLNYSARLELMHLLIMLAHADGDFAPSEQSLLIQIAANLGISQAEYQSLLAPYQKTQNADWAYDLLEISSSASDEDVKKAYRKMAMKYHPDKVHNLGEEVHKTATEKFRSVNEAYESIKKSRGMA